MAQPPQVIPSMRRVTCVSVSGARARAGTCVHEAGLSGALTSVVPSSTSAEPLNSITTSESVVRRLPVGPTTGSHEKPGPGRECPEYEGEGNGHPEDHPLARPVARCRAGC